MWLGWQYMPPRVGEALVGWRIQATFPTGPKNALQWHDGFVVACCEQRPEEGRLGTSSVLQVPPLLHPVDADDDWISPPFDDKSVCFRKAHLPDPKASADELRSAAAALAVPVDSDEE
ncbi:hypothetical protein OAO87_03065 [bacterium]|nr:hypothetical protein [bacterium]